MNYLERYSNRMKIKGLSAREETIYTTKNVLREIFAKDANYKDSIFKYDCDNGEVSKDFIPIRLYGETFSLSNGKRKKFQTIDEEIVVGDVFVDKTDNSYWICTESMNKGDINYEGLLTYCNYILPFQDSNGKIYHYPCVDVNATQYSSGEDYANNMIVGSTKHILYLTKDINTLRLKSPKRVYIDICDFDMTVYKITQNDNVSYNIGKGIVRLTCVEDVEVANSDRADLKICDYIEIKSEDKNDNIESNDTIDENVSENLITANIKYTSTIIKSGGNYKTFTAEFTDSEGNVVDVEKYNWSIVCDFKDKLDIVEEENKIKIKINDDSCIGEMFVLTLSDDNGNSASVTLEVRGLFG